MLREIERRVGQGHREIVLTGVNLGCFRDRDAGYTLARLVREAGAIDGPRTPAALVDRDQPRHAELVAALRETPAVSPHLHVPLQSGDDRVLRAMGRRYTVDQFLRRLEPLAGFNLTSDVIVGFPAEDERAFAGTLDVVARAGLTKVHVFPYSPRPGTRTAASDTVPRHVKRERGAALRRLSDDLCRRRWQGKLGSCDRVLVDRPGRGYGDDYSPWLVDAPVGCIRHGARDRRLGGGDPRCPRLSASSAGSSATAITSMPRTGSSPFATSLPRPRRTSSCFRCVTSTRSARSPTSRTRRQVACSRFVAETAERAGLEDYRVVVNVGPGGGQTVFHLHWHLLGGASLPGFG